MFVLLLKKLIITEIQGVLICLSCILWLLKIEYSAVLVFSLLNRLTPSQKCTYIKCAKECFCLKLVTRDRLPFMVNRMHSTLLGNFVNGIMIGWVWSTGVGVRISGGWRSLLCWLMQDIRKVHFINFIYLSLNPRIHSPYNCLPYLKKRSLSATLDLLGKVGLP